MRKDDQNVQVFRHVAENLTYDFFKIWLSEVWPFHGNDFKSKKA